MNEELRKAKEEAREAVEKLRVKAARLPRNASDRKMAVAVAKAIEDAEAVDPKEFLEK